MSVFTIPNVAIKGLAVSVPKQTADNLSFEILSEKERELFVKTVGIRYRRIAPTGTTASDLCFEAADNLLEEMQWNKEEVRVLVFVTQTPDYIIPNTSSILQQRLGLSKNCIVFDVNLGCSGYVYGLSIVAGLLQNMPTGKGLLLVGDISTATISNRDKSTAPLFSDAGSATALEFSLNCDMQFNLQTDGSGYDDIIIEDGGYRNFFSETSAVPEEIEKGIVRSKLQMKLDGLKIFNFALREVAPNINQLLNETKTNKDNINYFVFHQANLLMLESIRKKLSIESERAPYSLYDFGNTSSATIPVTLVSKLREELSTKNLHLALSGFGVGLSWGTCILKTNQIVCLPIIEV
jgi:3-oxoacyl-[acyl-carrier-protein] synthase-3